VNNLLKKKNTTLLRNKLAPLIAEVFGYFSLLYTQEAEELVSNKILIRNQITLFNESSLPDNIPSNPKNDNLKLQCKFEELPISSDSIDLILMPEVLQTSNFPHQVLREAERVLIPEGTIILIINNPIGITTLKKEFNNILDKLTIIIKTGNFPKNRNQLWFSLGPRRIKDWLNLLGIETTSQIPVCYDLTSQSKAQSPFMKFKNKIKQFVIKTFADQIIIVGKKKVSTLTPIRQSWRRNKRFSRPRFAEPSVQQHAESCLIQITK